jgi:type I restriction enzyme S subunit
VSNEGLPSGWSQATFSSIATIASNLVEPRSFGHMPHIAPDNIERDTGRLLPFRTIAEDRVTSAKHRFHAGQILYSKIRPYLNKCVRAKFGGLCSADMYPIDAAIEPEYLRHYMLTSAFVAAVSQAAGSRTVLPKTNQEQMASVPVPVAPLPEQHRIVEAIEDYFSRLDEAVALLERVQRNLKRYRASVLKAAVEGRLVPTEAELARTEGRTYEPASVLLERILEERHRRWEQSGRKGKYQEPAAPDTTDLPELPEGWCWASGDQLAERITKGSSPNWQGFDYVTSGVPFVRSQNIRWGSLALDDIVFVPQSFNEKETRSVLKRNDVLLNIVGASIGRSAVVDERIDGGNTNQAVAIVRLAPGGMDPWMACFYLISPVSQKTIHDAKVDVARANLSLADISGFPFPLPPAAEQARIRAAIDHHLSIADVEEREVARNVERSTRLRQSILKWAFEGRLADQDPADEPAAVLLERIRAERAASDAAPKAARRGRPRRQGTPE